MRGMRQEPPTAAAAARSDDVPIASQTRVPFVRVPKERTCKQSTTAPPQPCQETRRAAVRGAATMVQSPTDTQAYPRPHRGLRMQIQSRDRPTPACGPDRTSRVAGPERSRARTRRHKMEPEMHSRNPIAKEQMK